MISYILPIIKQSTTICMVYYFFIYKRSQCLALFHVVPFHPNMQQQSTYSYQLLLNPKCYYNPSQCYAPSISKHGQFIHISFTKSNPVPFVIKYKVQV